MLYLCNAVNASGPAVTYLKILMKASGVVVSAMTVLKLIVSNQGIVKVSKKFSFFLFLLNKRKTAFNEPENFRFRS